MLKTVLKTMKSAGAEVISAGGQRVDVTIGSGVTLYISIVRDPHNLFLELVQRMK